MFCLVTVMVFWRLFYLFYFIPYIGAFVKR